MNNLLIFFALPLATVIIAIVLERIWKNYILVTLFTFAVYLIVAFALGDSTLLVLVIIYTALAFIAAFLSMLFKRLSKRLRNLEDVAGESENNDTRNRCRCCNNSDVGAENESNNCNNSQEVTLNATVNPNSCNNGRTGTFRGRYRRI